MKKDIPELKKQLIEHLKTISDDKEFILSVGSYAGQNEEDARKVIEYIDSIDTPTESDIITYALKIYYKVEASQLNGTPKIVYRSTKNTHNILSVQMICDYLIIISQKY